MSEGAHQRRAGSGRGVIIAVVVLALAVIGGTVFVLTTSGKDQPAAAGSPSPPEEGSTPAPPPAPAPAKGDSICGLPGEVLEGQIDIGPEAEWEYHGTFAYPTSQEYGPAAADEKTGYRYCFQHSPEGALFAATNAAVQGNESESAREWLNYFIADGPHRDTLLPEDDAPSDGGNEMRIKVAGFRLLAYDGTSARVDVALQGTGSGNTLFASLVYDLVWEAGDWKLLPQDLSNPLRMVQIPDTAGYISWGE